MPPGVWVQVPPSARESTASRRNSRTQTTEPPTVTTDGNHRAQHRPHPLARSRRDHRVRPAPGRSLVVLLHRLRRDGPARRLPAPRRHAAGDLGPAVAPSGLRAQRRLRHQRVVGRAPDRTRRVRRRRGRLLHRPQGRPGGLRAQGVRRLQREERRAHERVLRALRRTHDHPRPLRAHRAHVRTGRRRRRPHEQVASTPSTTSSAPCSGASASRCSATRSGSSRPSPGSSRSTSTSSCSPPSAARRSSRSGTT